MDGGPTFFCCRGFFGRVLLDEVVDRFIDVKVVVPEQSFDVGVAETGDVVFENGTNRPEGGCHLRFVGSRHLFFFVVVVFIGEF